MMTAEEARERVSQQSKREQAVERCKHLIEEAVEGAVEKGLTYTPFKYDSYVIDDVVYHIGNDLRHWLSELGYTFDTIYGGNGIIEQIRW